MSTVIEYFHQIDVHNIICFSKHINNLMTFFSSNISHDVKRKNIYGIKNNVNMTLFRVIH